MSDIDDESSAVFSWEKYAKQLLLERDALRAEVARLKAVLKVCIDIEKLLCKALKREWSPSGFSIESMIEELAAANAKIDELQGGKDERFRYRKDYCNA